MLRGDAEFAEAERIDDDEPRTFDAREVQIKDFCLYRIDTLTFEYVYDFGDDWVHRITLEKPLVVNRAAKASCVEGARCCPPEVVPEARQQTSRRHPWLCRVPARAAFARA